jgi:hydrogenase 3 maturation protease
LEIENMSNRTWQENLLIHLSRLRKPGLRPRVAILGVGHDLCGDDAVGVRLAESLSRSLGNAEDVLIVEAGSAPENFTGLLRRFRPDLVLVVDAAQMQAEPGTVRWLEWENVEQLGASTHSLPLPILVRFLSVELGCQVALIGIQPEQTFREDWISPPVRKAAREVSRSLAAVL